MTEVTFAITCTADATVTKAIELTALPPTGQDKD